MNKIIPFFNRLKESHFCWIVGLLFAIVALHSQISVMSGDASITELILIAAIIFAILSRQFIRVIFKAIMANVVLLLLIYPLVKLSYPEYLDRANQTFTQANYCGLNELLQGELVLLVIIGIAFTLQSLYRASQPAPMGPSQSFVEIKGRTVKEIRQETHEQEAPTFHFESPKPSVLRKLRAVLSKIKSELQSRNRRLALGLASLLALALYLTALLCWVDSDSFRRERDEARLAAWSKGECSASHGSMALYRLLQMPQVRQELAALSPEQFRESRYAQQIPKHSTENMECYYTWAHLGDAQRLLIFPIAPGHDIIICRHNGEDAKTTPRFSFYQAFSPNCTNRFIN